MPNVREFQRSLNRFTGKYLKLVGPVRVDGVLGPSTVKTARQVQYWLGYGTPKGKFRITPVLVRRMRHPRDPRYSPPGMLLRAFARRRKQRKHARPPSTSGVTTFDGRPVAAWLVPYLRWARAQGWDGTLVSGYRTPAYSQQLCYQICGAPSCPGLCAGTSSNHTKHVKPGGALDVSFYDQFGQIIARCPYEPRIFNALPRDRVHFSATGG